MSLKHIDIGQALRNLADRRIEDAMKEGKFDNLQGAGEPLDLEPMPAEENARLTWWCVRILKQNDYTPDEIRWRKMIDTLKDQLHCATSERNVAMLVEQINLFVHKVNTLGTNAMKAGIAPVDLQAEQQHYRDRITR